MQTYFATLTVVIMIGMVVVRIIILKKRGIEAMKFGQMDKKDFLIPPFAFLYFYILLSNTFNFPKVTTQVFFHSELISWIGVALCLAGLYLLLWSLISFGQSFRVGIDPNQPDKLITNGAFGFSRNPIYVSFASILIGQFCIFPNVVFLVYIGIATWLFHRQILREEEFMKGHYGEDYREYCCHVRRYL
jgi:protein-S-isoprenylcysteine O-methyltransferase Ste14